MTAFQVTQIPDTPIQIKGKLKTGSAVVVNGKEENLGKSFASGGEADLYYIQNNSTEVVKIYKPGKVTERKKAKLENLISIGIDDVHICSPLSVVKNRSGQLVGFTMHKCPGGKQAKTLKQRLIDFDGEGFQGWTRQNIVVMVSTIIRLLFVLYSIPNHRVLIGDINLDNFVVVSPTEIYLVDVDSIQVDSFPCPVGQDNFVPPELQGKSFSNILRTPENEQFAFACLLFLCLMNNKAPFAVIGGESPSKNIQAGNFPYRADGTVSHKVPAGNWKYYWAFLPDYIREAFCRTFTSDVSHRTHITEWVKLFDRYLGEFSDLLNKDSMTGELVQTRYPKWMNSSLVKCQGCGEMVPPDQIDRTLYVCPTCVRSGIKLIRVQCHSCKKEFLVSNAVNQGNLSAQYCPYCLEYVNVECTLCGKIHKVRRYKIQTDRICKACQKIINDTMLLADNMTAMIKGSPDANLFISVPVSERLKDLIDHPEKVENILDSLKNFGGKCLPVYEELKNLWELSKSEASAFSDIQVKLLMDFNLQSHTDENVSYWKQMLEKVRTGSAQVENKLVKYSSFPIFSSCVAAIQKHIERLLNQQQEDLIREQERIAAEKAEKEKQRKEEEERRKEEEKRKKEKQLRTEENVRCLIKGILVGVGIFALLALIGWALTFVESIEIILTLIVSGIAIFLCILMFTVFFEDLVYPICFSIVIAVVLGFCIFLIWLLEIGTGVAEFMTVNFKEYLKWSGIGSSIAAVIAGIFFKCR